MSAPRIRAFPEPSFRTASLLASVVASHDVPDDDKATLSSLIAALEAKDASNNDLREALDGCQAAWRELNGENNRLRALLSKQDSGEQP